MDSRKRQTSTVTPAQPGDFPLWFKRGLIQAVHNVHPEYESIKHKLPDMYYFLRKFNTVFSLNYDLLTY